MDEKNLRDFDLDKLETDQALVAERFWDKVRTTLGKVPFMEDAIATFACATDPKTPLFVQAVFFAALAYFITPMDVIPDFIAGLGFTDDAAVLAAAIAALRSHLKPGHYALARTFLRKEKEKET